MQEALDQPLNPELIARSVQNEDEALEVYYLSCLVIDVDHFMERGYLDALAQALKIPADVKRGIESDVNEKNASWHSAAWQAGESCHSCRNLCKRMI